MWGKEQGEEEVLGGEPMACVEIWEEWHRKQS